MTLSNPSILPVSVVMSVFDRGDLLSKSIDSVLSQSGVEFELVIVDDGADAEVEKALDVYRSDSRVRVLPQLNRGLTQALIRACDEATMPLLARLDVGDVMLNDRLVKQATWLSNDKSLGMVSCWVNMCTEEGAFLYQIHQSPEEQRLGVTATSAELIQTPFHASVMMRKSTYLKAGGYRPQFYFSQDCDLWPRIAEHSKLDVVPEVLLEGIFSASGLSGRYASFQSQFKSLVALANRARANGESDNDILLQANELRPSATQQAHADAKDEFSALYFLAKCLDDNRSAKAMSYWRRAIWARPWSIKAWVYFFRSLLRTSTN